MALNSNFRTITADNIEGIVDEKNYLKSNFENGQLTGWDRATVTMSGTTPQNTISTGSGTAPSMTTFSTTTSSPLSGKASLNAASSAAWSAGHGFISDAFSIDRMDAGKVLSVSFDYEVSSGATNANFSGLLASQTFAIYIWDHTASSWIQPAGYLGINQSSGPGRVACTFQTSVVVGQQYKVAVFPVNASLGAISLRFDNFTCSRQPITIGPVVTDWQNYTPTVTYSSGSASNVTHYGRWRRVGDSAEVEVSSVWSSTTTAFTRPIYSLPAGLTIDTTKNTGSVVGALTDELIGLSRANDSAANAYLGGVSLNTTTSFYPHIINASTTYGSYADFTNVIPFTIGAGDSINSLIRVPIVGWSSNVTLSSSNDTRVVAAQFGSSTANLTTTSATTINWPQVNYDTHGAYSAGTYTIPVSGFYEVSINEIGINANDYLFIYKNGSKDRLLTYMNTAYPVPSAVSLLQCNAGDAITIRTANGTQINYSAGNYQCKVTIKRLSGPSVIAASETVAASYWASANGTSTSTAPVNFDSKEYDTHNAVTTGASWKFTAPVSGTYQVSTYINQVGAAASYFRLYKNSTSVSYKALNYLSTSAGGINAITAIKLNAGDYIGIYSSASINYFGNTSLSNDTPCHIDIVRVGN